METVQGAGMPWSGTAWEAAEPVYRRILEHPFVRELSDGSLPHGKFIYYIEQDALYLKEFGRSMAAAAARFTDPSAMSLFLHFAMDNLAAEKSLHESFLGAGAGTASASPVCLLCSSHLWKQVTSSSVEVALAAVLPCFSVYGKVGMHIFRTAVLDGNPYRGWIETYADGGFSGSTGQLMDLCDRFADNASPGIREEMTEAFVTGVKLEWMFWDSAYGREQWRI